MKKRLTEILEQEVRLFSSVGGRQNNDHSYGSFRHHRLVGDQLAVNAGSVVTSSRHTSDENAIHRAVHCGAHQRDGHPCTRTGCSDRDDEVRLRDGGALDEAITGALRKSEAVIFGCCRRRERDSTEEQFLGDTFLRKRRESNSLFEF